MAEQAVVHIGENSPEEVAYKLPQDIMDSEQRTKHPKLKEKTLADRKWLLDTYAECLNATKGHRPFK